MCSKCNDELPALKTGTRQKENYYPLASITQNHPAKASHTVISAEVRTYTPSIVGDLVHPPLDPTEHVGTLLERLHEEQQLSRSLREVIVALKAKNAVEISDLKSTYESLKRTNKRLRDRELEIMARPSESTNTSKTRGAVEEEHLDAIEAALLKPNSRNAVTTEPCSGIEECNSGNEGLMHHQPVLTFGPLEMMSRCDAPSAIETTIEGTKAIMKILADVFSDSLTGIRTKGPTKTGCHFLSFDEARSALLLYGILNLKTSLVVTKTENSTSTRTRTTVAYSCQRCGFSRLARIFMDPAKGPYVAVRGAHETHKCNPHVFARYCSEQYSNSVKVEANDKNNPKNDSEPKRKRMKLKPSSGKLSKEERDHLVSTRLDLSRSWLYKLGNVVKALSILMYGLHLRYAKLADKIECLESAILVAQSKIWISPITEAEKPDKVLQVIQEIIAVHYNLDDSKLIDKINSLKLSHPYKPDEIVKLDFVKLREDLSASVKA